MIKCEVPVIVSRYMALYKWFSVIIRRGQCILSDHGSAEASWTRCSARVDFT